MSSVHDLGALDLNGLVALDVLLETRSVTVAARRLGVTQSAVSHTLRRLRGLFGDPLLVRAGEAMAPTPRAEALQGRLRDALSALRETLRPERFDPGTSTRVFRIAAPDLFSLLVLPGLLARLGREAPAIGLVVVPGGDLLHGEVDAAVAPNAPWALAPDRPAELFQRTLLDDVYGCFLRPEHPVATLDLDAYVALGHVVVSPTGRGESAVDIALRAIGRARRVVLRVSGFAEATAVAMSTDLVLTAPRSLLGIVPHARVLPPPLELPAQGIALRWHARLDRDPGQVWFRALLAEAARG